MPPKSLTKNISVSIHKQIGATQRVSPNPLVEVRIKKAYAYPPEGNVCDNDNDGWT